MSKLRTSVFLKLERQLTSTTTEDVLIRWRYGCEVLKAKAGRKQLPDGYIDDRIKEAEADGRKLSRREIQYRVRSAEVYQTDQQVRKIVCTVGTWSEIIAAGFPEAPVDETPSVGDVLDDIEGGIGDPQEFEQPGLFPDLVKKIPLPVSPLRHLVAYAEEMRGMTASYAKRDDERQAHLQELTIAAGGDLDVTYQDALAMLRAKQMAASST